MGTRRELIRNLRRRGRGDGPGGAALRPLRLPPWQSGSESRPSPIQRRATASKRDALKGESSGSLRGVLVRGLSRVAKAQPTAYSRKNSSGLASI
jgi:hypothetical protein